MTLDWTPFVQAEPLPGGRPASCTSSDYSPTTDTFSYPEAFDKAYIADAFSTQPDYSLDDWVTSDYYDRPISSVEVPKQPADTSTVFAPKNHSVFNTSLRAAIPTLNPWQTVNAPFGSTLASGTDGAFAHSLPFGTLHTDSFDSSCHESLRDAASPTPSLCGDSCHLGIDVRPASPAASNHSTSNHSTSNKRASPDDSAENEHAPKRTQRKRGRPRLSRSEADPTSNYTPDSPNARLRVSRRLPHNQVERKYREGLNSELERLRRAVPTLPQRDSGDLTGPPKPSKATVLASAISYIKSMEEELERMNEELERLRGMRAVRGPTNARLGAKLRGYGWSKPKSSSSSSMSLGT